LNNWKIRASYVPSKAYRCGFIALVGRPNVGKSTLLNRLIGQKISITSRRPQTTRHRIIGIKTLTSAQLIYVDTPGLHRYSGRAMNRHMNRTATMALQDVDAVVFLVEGLRWTPDDELVLTELEHLHCPVILAVNKVDLIADKETLLPGLQDLSRKRLFTDVIPLSARKGDNVDQLETCVEALLPVGEAFFPSVDVEHFRREHRCVHIHALIWVERQSQKTIVIGKQGAVLREVGQQARIEIEKMLESKVNLKLWVKVKEGWADDERALKSLGYADDGQP
jgi:GTP-binding protein Era